MAEVVNDDAGDLAAARRGDSAAYGRLYDRHAAVVMSLCRRRGLTEADDAAQETFIRAFAMLERVEEPGRFRSWLYGIARRVCSERRRAANRRIHHEEHAMRLQMDEHAGTTEHESKAAERDEALARLDAAMAQLDDRERLAIHLYYLEADPIQAAAEGLGLSRSAYYKLVGRARQHLAELMGTMNTNEVQS